MREEHINCTNAFKPYMVYLCIKNILFCSTLSGFSLTPYLESFTPTFGLGTPVFPRISSNLHCGTPTFSKRCLWDSYFQNPCENPVYSTGIKNKISRICHNENEKTLATSTSAT